MKATELRIGNYVYQGNKYKFSKVTSYELCNFDTKEKGGVVAEYYQEWKPIPLTEEWLLKFGFEKYNECFYKIEVKRGYSDGWYFSHDNELTKSMSDFFVRLKYVHELQNFWFALTGEELNIK